jgi:hypothetical protein
MKTGPNRISNLTTRLSKDLLGLRRDLIALGRAVQALSTSHRDLTRKMVRGPSQTATPGRRRRRTLTPADLRRLKVQGEYLGLVRRLSVRQRARVKALKADKGYGPALKLARSFGR